MIPSHWFCHRFEFFEIDLYFAVFFCSNTILADLTEWSIYGKPRLFRIQSSKLNIVVPHSYCRSLSFKNIQMQKRQAVKHHNHDVKVGGFGHNIYRPQRSWAKVIFLQACVCPQGGGVSASVHAGIPPGPGRHPPPPGADIPLPLEQTTAPPPGADQAHLPQE